MTRISNVTWFALLSMMTLAMMGLSSSTSMASEQANQLKERIVLVHGLGRTPTSMWLLSERLEGAGYEVVRISYRSMSDDPATIIKDVTEQIDACCAAYKGVTHYVGHSLGGLVIRAYLDQHRPENLGRIVLLGSPSNGTKVVDNLSQYQWFRWLGPTTLSLGTDLSQYPDGKTAPDYSVGVIAGMSETVSKMNDALLPGDDDGLVSVDSTKIEGMKDFLIVRTGHAGLRYSKQVAEQVVHFLQTESFNKPEKQESTAKWDFSWQHF